ncbi:MAG: tetratricopeptide repeat-containing sensor histidine kinase [Bacteroidia bacterium]
MNKCRIYIILLFCFYSGVSQQNPEIKTLLKEVKEASYYDSLRLFNAGKKALEKATEVGDKTVPSDVDFFYGNYFFYVRKLDKARSYFKKSYDEAVHPHQKMLAQIRLSFLNYEAGDKETSLKELDTLLASAKKQNDYENTVELLNLIGITKEENNDTRGAVKYYMEGLALSEAKNLSHYPAVFRNNLGLIKFFSGQTADAIEDYTKGLEIAEKENNKRLTSHIEINLCVAYISTNKLKEAKVILNKVLNYFRANNLPLELASTYLNISSAFSSAKQYEPSLLYTDSAIEVFAKHNLKRELTKGYLNRTDLLIRLKRDKEAEISLKKAQELSAITGSLEDISSGYQLSYEIQSLRKNYKDALTDYNLYITTKDSLGRNQTAKLIKEMNLKYNVQKKETELEKEKTKTLLLEAKNQKERFYRSLTVGISLILMLVSGILIYLRYLKKTREQQEYFSRQLIESAEAERLRISRDLHDDIGQSLSMIKSKISAGKVESSQNLEGELGRVIEQTREISKNLYPSYLEKIGLVRSVARLVENIQSSTKLECSFDVSEDIDYLPITTKTHIYRILQECVNNTIKHSGATALKISIELHANEFFLTYQDNGKGLEETKAVNGIGMFSIRERAKIIHANLHIGDKTQKGFKLTMSFKN